MPLPRVGESNVHDHNIEEKRKGRDKRRACCFWSFWKEKPRLEWAFSLHLCARQFVDCKGKTWNKRRNSKEIRSIVYFYSLFLSISRVLCFRQHEREMLSLRMSQSRPNRTQPHMELLGTESFRLASWAHLNFIISLIFLFWFYRGRRYRVRL